MKISGFWYEWFGFFPHLLYFGIQVLQDLIHIWQWQHTKKNSSPKKHTTACIADDSEDQRQII